MKIAIHQNKDIFNHSSLWTDYWIDYCNKNNINFQIVDCYSSDILTEIRKYDLLLWHVSGYAIQEVLFAKSIINSIEKLGIEVFPNNNLLWHFDDKIAENYFLQAVNATIPNSWIFYTYNDAINFFRTSCKYPIVAKLRNGSGSNNVKLIKNYKKAKTYSKKMFGKGIKSTPSILFKAKSNFKSAKDWSTIKNRLKRIPDFIESLKKANKLPREQGYIYLQEYIPNNGYDLKVIVVNNKVTFVARNIRKNDFRASGGGDLLYDKSLLTKEIRDLARTTSNKLGFLCMGYDFVVDKNNNKPYIIEISYGFSSKAQEDLKGYWDEKDEWVNKPLIAPHEIIKTLTLRHKNEIEV